MTISSDEDRYRIDPDKLPKQIDIDLPARLEEHLLKIAAASGRSVDEIFLEILDKNLQDP